MVSVDVNWQVHGLRVVRIENDILCIDILPELGAKIYNFIHKPSGRNLLWHNPHLLPTHQRFGASFDDNWSGGWDELLPNDLPNQPRMGICSLTMGRSGRSLPRGRSSRQVPGGWRCDS